MTELTRNLTDCTGSINARVYDGSERIWITLAGHGLQTFSLTEDQFVQLASLYCDFQVKKAEDVAVDGLHVNDVLRNSP